ncbi:MAG TPA: phosphomannomutase/phosphoglucomutase [Gemmatimonadaceae bacterium]|nr:phosphomannomutase/phosphoglucomutase [Gemmatimonadaceae bacterium]
MSIPRGIFREYDIRGIAGTDLTRATARLIGLGYAAYLREQGESGAIAVGRDNRPSGAGLRDGLVEGLREAGLDVVDIGEVPTPVTYWAQHKLDVIGGIQITGSHNPAEYNGFKLGLRTKSIYGQQIQRMWELISAGDFPRGEGALREEALIDRYVDDIVRLVGPLKRKLRVVADCGNGAGALVAPKMLERMGLSADLLFCESDGTFPNHHPDPTVAENVADLITLVKANNADLGVAFDGDADRIGVIDNTGEIIWGDYLLILYARDVLQRTGPGQSIVFDVKCTQALPDAIAKAGGVPVMSRTGHSLVEEKMHETHAPVGGEMSGHMFFTEGFYGFDDALYAAARLIRIVADSGKSVRELLADVPRFVSTPEIRVHCDDDKKFPIVEEAKRYFSARYETNDIDGVRILFEHGWGLIRASNTQPVIVMRFEADTAEQLAAIRGEVEGWLAAKGVAV